MQITYTLLFVNSFIALGSDYIIVLCKCYLRPTAIFLDLNEDTALSTQPPHQEHVLNEFKKWVTSMPNSNVRFSKEDIIAGGVQISQGLISGEYVLLQIHVKAEKSVVHSNEKW